MNPLSTTEKAWCVLSVLVLLMYHNWYLATRSHKEMLSILADQ
jgi:hypothetical protein